MKSILYSIVFVAANFYMWWEMKHALHMFQQNHYEMHRYAWWMKDRFSFTNRGTLTTLANQLLFIAFFIIAMALPIVETLVLVIDMILLFVLIYLNCMNEKNISYIKPLVITDRVKRQIFVMFVMNILFFLNVFVKFDCRYLSIFIAIWDMMQWLLVYVMAILTTPLEAAFHMYYKNNAKKMLRSNTDLKIVGITGSYGKTSSKHILQEILAERYYSLMTPGSFNTPMGISTTITQELKPIHQVFICEMGADKVGDIDELMHFVRPKYGVLTTIGPQHLQTFHTQENITKEKFNIIEELPEDGVGFINLDNEFIRNYTIKNTCKIVSFAIENEEADFRALNIHYTPSGSTFEIAIKNMGTYPFETRLLGKHNISNILAAVAVGYELGITIEELQLAVSHVKYVEHRLQVKKQYGQTWIDNAFNSNPVGALMSLEVMQMMPGTRFILTPGLIDLGAIQDECNKNFGMHMKGCVDEVLLIGPEQSKPIHEGLEESGFDMEHVHTFNSVQEAFEFVRSRSIPGDTILLENDLPDAFKH